MAAIRTQGPTSTTVSRLPSRRDGWWLAGVDGCRGGWFVVLLRVATATQKVRALRFELCAQFSEVLALRPEPLRVAIDIPIGLLDHPAQGGRECDRAARRILGRGRQSSVFSPPARRALRAKSYREAMRLNRRGISRQAFGILAKIREVDHALCPRLQRKFLEVHPELAFVELAGTPMQHNKKTRAGRLERQRVLQHYYGCHYIGPDALRVRVGRARVATHDILDAYALAHSAARIAAGHGVRLPGGDPPRDATGLRMEIWY